MERTPLPNSINQDLQKVLEYIQDEAPGKVLTLSAAPTTAGQELKENQWGIFGTDLYKNINGSVYKFSGVLVP